MPIPLLEPSEREIVRKVRRRVKAVQNVTRCEVHLTSNGKKPHVRVRVWLDLAPGYEAIHGVSSTIDREVRKVVPNARVSIRSEPEAGGGAENEYLWELVKRVAEHEPGSRGAHNIHLQNVEGKLGVDFHLEVSARMNVKQAHEVAARIEKKLKAADPRISEVVIHEETASDMVSSERAGHGSELMWYIDHVVKRFAHVELAGRPVIRRVGENQVHVIIHATFSPDLGMEIANQVTSRLEAAIKDGHPAIVRVDIVQEPGEPAAYSRSIDPPRA